MLEALALQAVWLALRLAALGADDAFRPADALKVFRCRNRVREALVEKL
jgi:hypothetical protein